MRNATFHGIPCWYNSVNDELIGKNRFLDFIVGILLWFDLKILLLDAIPMWVEVDELEKR